ncbi:U3 small nucleolar RNA-associated protein [Sorochytrium milnesiophthora]
MEVHCCRFVDYVPSAITAIAATPGTTRLVVATGRENGTIELRNPRENWMLESTIPGGENRAVSCLAWSHQTILSDPELYDDDQEREFAQRRLAKIGPRLFSGSLNGFITEWDLTTLRPKTVVDANGGGVWCMAVNTDGTQMVVGCENGSVKLYDLSDGNFEFERGFDPQKARVLSIDWHPDQRHVVSGSGDSTIRLWTADNGHVAQRMTLEKRKNRHTSVWAVKVLKYVPLHLIGQIGKDGTIVSGSSLGAVEFWDGKLGTRIAMINTHAAAVLCLAVSKDGKTVYSGSIDHKIAAIRYVKDDTGKSNAERWITSNGRRYHNHDIKALCLIQDKHTHALVSGGLDTELVVVPLQKSFKEGVQRRYLSFQSRPISYSRSQRLMLCQFDRSLKLYRFGSTLPVADDVSSAAEKAALRAQNRSARPLQPSLNESYQPLLHMRLQTVNNLTASHICETGEWVAASDPETVKLWRLQVSPASGEARVVKMPFQDLVPPARLLHFTPDGKRLVVFGVDSIVYVVDLQQWRSGSFPILCQFNNHSGQVAGTTKASNSSLAQQAALITCASISPDSRFLISADLLNRVLIFDLETLEHHKTLPKFPHRITSVSLSDKYAVITVSNKDFYVYDSPSFKVNKWTTTNLSRFDAQYYSSAECYLGAETIADQLIMLWTTKWIIIVNLAKNLAIPDKKRKTESGNGSDVPAASADEKMHDANAAGSSPVLRYVSKYHSLMGVGLLDANQMFVVERPWFDILQHLPPAFMRKKYGM